MDIAKFITPTNLSIANFCLFGLLLAMGLLYTDLGIIGASFGFFMAGASIMVLHVLGNWAYSETHEKEVKPNGVPQNKPEIQANID